MQNKDIRVTLIHEPRKIRLEKLMRIMMWVALLTVIVGQQLYISFRTEESTASFCGRHSLHLLALTICAFLAAFALIAHLGFSYQRRRTVKEIESYGEAAA